MGRSKSDRVPPGHEYVEECPCQNCTVIRTVQTLRPSEPPKKDHDPRCDLFGKDCTCGKTQALEKAVQHLLRTKPWQTHKVPEWMLDLVDALDNL